MYNAIFSSSTKSYPVAHINHAGPVVELSQQEERKRKNTHYFRITTTRGVAYCHFNSEESARRSRGVLGAMLGTIKPHLFHSKGDCIDIKSINSFGRVMELKGRSDSDNDVFGFPVNMATLAENNDTVWLTFQTEESARNVRKALFAKIISLYSPMEDVLIDDDVEDENGCVVEDKVMIDA